MDGIGFNIRTATISDRSRLANLIHFSPYIHQHLDWKPPLEWIGKRPYLLLEKKGSLLAALACPPELPEITWIRLFTASISIAAKEAWKLLWAAAADELSQNGGFTIAALSLQGWFNGLLDESNFAHTDNVIVLMWDSTHAYPKPESSDITIRPMIPEDLPTIFSIDNAAFGLEWRNSLESLELAFQQSSMARVAEAGEEIVGYQCSTSSVMGGHLARLAVNPGKQGQGIGYLLVYDVLQYFQKQGVMHVTVNTQQNNTTSLALYAKAGFCTTGESYRVYQYTSE